MRVRFCLVLALVAFGSSPGSWGASEPRLRAAEGALAARLLVLCSEVLGSEGFERLCGTDAELARHHRQLLQAMNAGARHLARPGMPQV